MSEIKEANNLVTQRERKSRVEKHGSGSLGLQLVANMKQMTMDRIGTIGMNNAQDNLRYLKQGKTLRELRGKRIGEGDHAIVVAAGPSLKRRNVADRIKTAHYRGAIVTSESGISYCLRNGIVPDLVVTLDPHATRIVRWFGDPKLNEDALKADNYFSRQDMDIDFQDELKANREIIELLSKYGKRMKIALSTSASKAVVERVLETGMEIYWWNPMYDDPSAPNSKTRALYELNRLPCVNAGGNVGTACWMMAHAVLGKSQVALTGVDFSYYDGTPYRNTQYYYEALNLVGEDGLDEIYIRIFNPYLNAWSFTDPAYMWYRETFLEMAADADCKTYNCTEGGILFGENIEFVSLDAFLNDVTTLANSERSSSRNEGQNG